MENLVVMRDAAFWRGKRVLLTGHTGFKGSWLAIWLHHLGAHVTGISLPPATQPNLFTEAKVDTLCDSRFCDIRDAAALADIVQKTEPEIVFHLAAQPLVRASYRAPLDTFDTNIMGTANVLDALCGVDCARVAVMVTTDKVYRDATEGRPYREDDPLGGHDPYSASKAACEIVIAGYRELVSGGERPGGGECARRQRDRRRRLVGGPYHSRRRARLAGWTAAAGAQTASRAALAARA